MATHDYVIANQGFPAFRSDLNSVLQAIVSNNSNATAPSTTYAYQMWYETDTNNWYMRNADNDAWITLATFNQTNDTVNFIDSSSTVAGISTSASATVLTLANGVVAINPAGYVSVGGAATQSGEIRFLEDTDNGANYITVRSPTANVAGANFTLTLPEITGDVLGGKVGGTNFGNSLLVGHATHGTLNSAERNIGIGITALDALTSADANIAIGHNAGGSINSGSDNVFIGDQVANAATTSNNNVGLGEGALSALQGGGNGNIALGRRAGNNITTGDGNVVIGIADVTSATGNDQLSISDGEDGAVVWIKGSSAGVVTLNAANVTQQAITSSSNAVAWDASAKPNAYHLTTENTTFSAPSNNIEGAFICIEINYDGSHTIAFNTIFNFAADTAPTFTSTNGKTDILVFKYNGSVYQEVGRTLNISEA